MTPPVIAAQPRLIRALPAPALGAAASCRQRPWRKILPDDSVPPSWEGWVKLQAVMSAP